MKSSRPGRFGCRATSTRCHGVSVAYRSARIDSTRRRSDVDLASAAHRCAAAATSASISFRRTRDRFFELEGLRRHTHHRSDTDALARRPALDFRDERSTRDGRESVRRHRRARAVAYRLAGSSISNETRRSPRWRAKISPSASKRPRSAGPLHPDRDLARQPFAHRLDAARSRTPGSRTDSSSRSSLPRTSTIAPVSIKASRIAGRPRGRQSPRPRPARPRA